MRERVRQRELRPVGGAPDADLIDAERLPDGLDVLGMVARGVESPARADRVRAVRRELRGLLDARVDGRLERRAVEEAGAPRSADVEGDERVEGKERPEERRVRAEVEDAGGGLPGAAREQEHHAALE